MLVSKSWIPAHEVLLSTSLQNTYLIQECVLSFIFKIRLLSPRSCHLFLVNFISSSNMTNSTERRGVTLAQKHTVLNCREQSSHHNGKNLIYHSLKQPHLPCTYINYRSLQHDLSSWDFCKQLFEFPLIFIIKKNYFWVWWERKHSE